MWKVGYNHFDAYHATAEDLAGPTARALSSIAARRSCLVHGGSMVERTPEGGLRNTAVVFGPDGRIIARHSKIHLFSHGSAEARILEPGTVLTTASTAFGEMATATCYDLRFPGLWEVLVDNGVALMVVPAAWPVQRLQHWRLLSAARALDNQVFVIACNATGEHGGVQLAGHSRIVNPSGAVEIEADASEGVTIADIDPTLVARARADFPLLDDRLTSYGRLTPSDD